MNKAMKFLPKRLQKGFTLVELLIVIGILAVLLAIVLIALNPARQFSQANNTKRSSDVNAILNAVHQYSADNRGVAPAGIPAGVAADALNVSDGGANICAALVPLYLAQLPVDPGTNNGAPVIEADCAGTYDTNYQIVRSAANNRITVRADAAELGVIIEVTR